MNLEITVGSRVRILKKHHLFHNFIGTIRMIKQSYNLTGESCERIYYVNPDNINSKMRVSPGTVYAFTIDQIEIADILQLAVEEVSNESKHQTRL